MWEIEFETKAMLFDASFLDNIDKERNLSPLLIIDSAYRYWRGEMSKNPLPELLVPYPVTVIRKIRDMIPE